MYIENTNELKTLLTAWGYTQKDVAERVGISYILTHKVINGERSDKHGVFDTAIQMIKEAKRKRERLEKAAADLMPAA